jgi:hypothetical protein
MIYRFHAVVTSGKRLPQFELCAGRIATVTCLKQNLVGKNTEQKVDESNLYLLVGHFRRRRARQAILRPFPAGQ